MKLATSLALAACLTGCGQAAGLGVTVDALEHNSGQCDGAFHKIELDHVTAGPGTQAIISDGMGAGLAVGDLDNDGWDDLVLANLDGETSAFLSRGDLTFERRTLITGRFRHVAIADIDADGWNDVMLTTGLGRPQLGTNNGDGTFSFAPFSPVTGIAYSLGLADLGGDGDLDIVTGAYGAELTANRDLAALVSSEGGVSVYEKDDGSWLRTRLSRDTQALAIRLADINFDSRADIHVGNDFTTPDGIWVATERGWVPATPFEQTSLNTMSLDGGDVDNDGIFEILATDMYPMDEDPETLEAWKTVLEQPQESGEQRMENVLARASGERFGTITEDFGVGFTGWSWSGEFGDLDNDGFVDVYIVNGMESDQLFGHVEPAALIEPNQAFRNTGGTGMTPAPEWGLADTDGGRGMVMSDLDRDGDLDIVINNLNAPAALFENRVCGGRAVTVDLTWEGTANPSAISSVVRVSDGTETYSRLVEATRGYLSGYDGGAHIGVGDATEVTIEVVWPDQEVTTIEDVVPGQHLAITREATE